MATARKGPTIEEALAGDSGFISATEDPEGVARAVQKALQENNPLPDPVPPPDTHVNLPGGIRRGDEVITTAEVRELTGEHEEVLARAAQAKPGNLFHFMNVLLECGTVRFGTEDPGQTRKLLKNALVGDRDAIILGIRRATYGDQIEVERWQCPECGEHSDLVIPLDEIPVHELEGDTDMLEVPLRRGRTAQVRLASGADQLAVFENTKLLTAERDTILLSRCLVSITDPNGTKHTTAGFASSYARGLSAMDRHTILRELREKAPGPRFNEMKIEHVTCGKEAELPLGMADLFPDIILAQLA